MKKILSLDGGGIRGIIAGTFLTYIEKKLQELSGDENTRIADYFDFVAGTSTGGILAAMLLAPDENGRPKFTAEETLNLYLQKGYNIFNGSRRSVIARLGVVAQIRNATQYRPDYLEDLLKKYFGDMKVEELIKPCIIPAYDIRHQRAVFFRSREKKQRQYYLRDAVRSTSAGPTYFPPKAMKNLNPLEDEKENGLHEYINVDGGVFANNPLMCAYAECRKPETFPDRGGQPLSVSEMIVLSIGTGSQRLPFSNVQRSSRWGLVNWARNVPTLMMNGALDTTTYQFTSVFRAGGEQNMENFIRLDVPEEIQKAQRYSSDMDDASSRNVQRLRDAGELALKRAIEEQDLDGFIKKVFNN